MRISRFLFACLLSLGVAVQGYAGARTMEADCPMLHVMAAEPVSDVHAMHEMHDMAEMGPHHTGHADDSHAGKGTRHCACAMGCQPANSMFVAMPAMAGAVLVRHHLPPQAAPTFDSHTAFRHWRPPALI
jgi:hypothetical protein